MINFKFTFYYLQIQNIYLMELLKKKKKYLNYLITDSVCILIRIIKYVVENLEQLYKIIAVNNI